MGRRDQMSGRASANDCEEVRLRQGAGDALSQAFELVATPAVFGLLGWNADRHFNTDPVITLTAVLVVFVYQMWRFASDYITRMDKALEERRAGYTRPDDSELPSQP